MKPDFRWKPRDLRPYVYPNEEYWLAVQGMANRMAVSEHKYGVARDTIPSQRVALDSLQARIDLYWETGNTEWLLDAANMCVLEAIYPSHSEAHFRATDSDESPGVVYRETQ